MWVSYKGSVGEAENGLYLGSTDNEKKAICFISEYLVILLDKGDIVDNMHEAYSRIEMTDYGFGTFISGPSKTADIEQALVMGHRPHAASPYLYWNKDLPD